jgi:signal transduction histidine kinase
MMCSTFRTLAANREPAHSTLLQASSTTCNGTSRDGRDGFQLRDRISISRRPDDATPQIAMPRTFMETYGFLVLCDISMFGVAWLIVVWRFRQVRHRLHLMYEARVCERGRFARDLHDTLLQSSQGLVLKVHAVARGLPTDSPDRAVLDVAVKDADLMLMEVRDRIADLRNAGRTIARLRRDLIAIGEALARAGDVAFTHCVEECEQELHPDIADEVFGIGREALMNAFRHASAQQVKLELADTRAGFAMSVIDDGRGLTDASVAHAQAGDRSGMTGMRERATRIGALIEFSSGAGRGTEVVLTVPPLAAYHRLGFRSLRF